MFEFLIWIIVLLLIMWCLTMPIEEFNDNNNGIRARIHVKLDRDNITPIYYSPQSPPMNGESGCTQVPCPDNFDDNLVCWSCCQYY